MNTYSYVSCCFTHHEYLPFQSPKAMSILITKNTLHQLNLEGKKRNLAFLGNKNFKDKNGNRPLDKHIGRTMIKILHSLNVQLKWDIKQQRTQSIIVLGGFIIWSNYYGVSKEVCFCWIVKQCIPIVQPGDAHTSMVIIKI